MKRKTNKVTIVWTQKPVIGQFGNYLQLDYELEISQYEVIVDEAESQETVNVLLLDFSEI